MQVGEKHNPDNPENLILRAERDSLETLVQERTAELRQSKEKYRLLVHEEDREGTARAMEALYQPPYTAYLEQRAMTLQGWQ